MQRVTVDLSDLDIHRLDAEPMEAENAIEVQVHATINGVDETTLATLAGNSLAPESLVLSVRQPGDASATDGRDSNR